MRRLLLILLMLLPLTAWAVNVRGRVDFVVPTGIVPMNQAFVELCWAPTGNCLSYRTGYDGMYYFNGVPGPHFLRINGVVVWQFTIPAVPNFDIPPMRGNN